MDGDGEFCCRLLEGGRSRSVVKLFGERFLLLEDGRNTSLIGLCSFWLLEVCCCSVVREVEAAKIGSVFISDTSTLRGAVVMVVRRMGTVGISRGATVILFLQQVPPQPL